MFAIDLAAIKSPDNGINVRKLKPGTAVLVLTRNNLYKIVKQDYAAKVTVQGGKFFKEPTEGHFTGSTFGGTTIKLDWIGYLMHMEIHFPHGILRTTGVREAKVYGDGWEYAMEWESDQCANL